MRQLILAAAIGAVLALSAVPVAGAAGLDVSYVTLDDTTTSLHYYAAETTPNA